MNDPSCLLAQAELSRYGLEADLLKDPSLPAFELRRVDKRTVIAAPDPLELLYGVYDYAERFCGWSFFEPGRDKYDAAGKKELPDSRIFPVRDAVTKSKAKRYHGRPAGFLMISFFCLNIT